MNSLVPYQVRLSVETAIAFAAPKGFSLSVNLFVGDEIGFVPEGGVAVATREELRLPGIRVNLLVPRQIGAVAEAGVALVAFKSLLFPRIGFRALDDVRRLKPRSGGAVVVVVVERRVPPHSVIVVVVRRFTPQSLFSLDGESGSHLQRFLSGFIAEGRVAQSMNL